MSQYHVKKMNKPLDARVRVPGSKSITNRALLISALSGIRTTLRGVLFSDDTEVFANALKELGFPVEVNESPDPGECSISIRGERGLIPSKQGRVYVGSAGTAARFITAMLAFSEGEYEIQASEQMEKRPMKPLFDALGLLGTEIEYLKETGHLPVRIRGCFADPGKIKAFPVETVVDSDQSTQFLSALLMLSPLVAERTGTPFKIRVDGSRGKGAYVMMTLKVMEQFGVKVSEENGNDDSQVVFITEPGQEYEPGKDDAFAGGNVYEVEPDVSAAGYFFAAAAVTGGQVLLEGIHKTSMQGDIRFLDLLEKMGCSIKDTPEGIVLKGPEVERLAGIDADMRDFSDQTMTLAAIAPFCSSEVNIRNVAHIRKQESDRIHGMAAELKKMGVDVTEREDGLSIRPVGNGGIKPTVVETYNDHRMAMAFALTGLVADGIVIDDQECCSKTFKDYFKVLDRITG